MTPTRVTVLILVLLVGGVVGVHYRVQAPQFMITPLPVLWSSAVDVSEPVKRLLWAASPDARKAILDAYMCGVYDGRARELNDARKRGAKLVATFAPKAVK